MGRTIIGALVAAASVALAACTGFTPMYARPGVVDGSTRIDVDTPNTRTGYLLRESLEDALAWDRTKPPAYRLKVALEERRIQRGLDENRVATRYEVEVIATYILTDVGTGRSVLRGARPIHVTYDTTVQPYAGITAQQDAQVRAAGQAAEAIRTDILAYLATR